MHTFYQLYGIQDPEKVMLRLRQEQEICSHPRNLEEKAISMVGRVMYETLIKGYTEKQWGRKATELPPFIIARLPLRLFLFKISLGITIARSFRKPLSFRSMVLTDELCYKGSY